MRPSSIRAFVFCFGCAAGIGLAASPAQAQTTPPTKPAVKPAAKPAVVAESKSENKTLAGKGTSSGKLMTRDELRQCLARLDQINKDGKSLDERRDGLGAARSELAKQADALKLEREDVERRQAAVDEWQGRVKAHNAALDAFNKKVAGLEEASRSQREALQKELIAEGERLKLASERLAAEQDTLVPSLKSAVAAYNLKVESRQAKANEWNLSQQQLADSTQKHDDARGAWLTECANRPYREDDEIAIKQGR